MKIAIFGAGGVGGYFGGRLAAAGADVGVVARGAHLAAIRERGLSIKSPLGDAVVKPRVSDNPTDIGPVDAVLFCVKLYDVESAAPKLMPLLKKETAVISLQNGVDAEDRIERVIGPGHVAGGVAYISATIAEPGVIQHHGKFAALTFAELDGRRSARLDELLAACKAASGMSASISPDIRKAIWEKFIMISSMAAATALTRLSVGPIVADPDMRAMIEGAMREVEAVAKAQGIAISPDAVAGAMKTVLSVPPGTKASMLHDLEKGNRIEIEGLSGAVARLGKTFGVMTPVHSTAYAALKAYAEGPPKAA